MRWAVLERQAGLLAGRSSQALVSCPPWGWGAEPRARTHLDVPRVGAWLAAAAVLVCEGAASQGPVNEETEVEVVGGAGLCKVALKAAVQQAAREKSGRGVGGLVGR